MSGLSLSLSDAETDALRSELASVAPDALLGGPTLADDDGRAASEPRPFVLGAATTQQVALHLPGLNRVTQRLTRGLREVIEPFAHGRVQVSGVAPETHQYDEWKADLPYYIAVGHYRLPALQGGFAVMIEPDFVAGLVESFYGGSGIVRPPKVGEFTASEERLLAKLMDGIVALLCDAWADITPFAPVLAARETTATHIALVRAEDQVVLQQFTVIPAVGRPSTLTIVYPVAMLRPIEDSLATRAHDAVPSGDPEWRQRMAAALEDVTVPVRSVLARPEISLARLMTLKPGDVIPIQIAPLAPLLAGTRELGLGTLGEQDGRAALMIQHMGPNR